MTPNMNQMDSKSVPKVDGKTIQQAANLASTYEAMFRFKVAGETEPGAKEKFTNNPENISNYIQQHAQIIQGYLNPKEQYLGAVEAQLKNTQGVDKKSIEDMLTLHEDQYNSHDIVRKRFSEFAKYIVSNKAAGEDIFSEEGVENLAKAYLNIVRNLSPQEEDLANVEAGKYITSLFLAQEQENPEAADYAHIKSLIGQKSYELAGEIRNKDDPASTKVLSIDALAETYKKAA